MDYKQYIELIHENPKKAQQYKNTFIPNSLFKYVGLFDDESRNKKRFNSLESAELHLGKYVDYNDPFEGTFFLIDEKKLEDKGWKPGLVTELYRNLVDGFRICSLSDTDEHNMPMWAHYANNHRGFCVEYNFTEKQKNYIFPVSYEKKRQEATTILANLIQEELHIALNNQDTDVSEKLKQLSEESSDTNLLIFLSIAAKHESWSYEKEYRIIASDRHDTFPSIPSRIYAGMNCDDENVNALKEIVTRYQKDGVPVELYKMIFDSMDKDFQLRKERIV